MEKRIFGKTGVEVSPLGFGCMRLPLIDPLDPATIDIEEATRMVRHAIDNGVNYIDTAYPYHSGQSEVVVGKILQDGYREKVNLATKCPIWALKKEEDFFTIFEEQLEKLQTDHIDFYLLHALNKDRLDTIIKFKLYEKIEKLKAEGKIKYIGFSFHDVFETFPKILDSYDKWDFCQIQLNYLDTDYQAGLRGLELAKERNLGIVIMEPVKGGRLASIPKSMVDIFKSANEERADVAWAFDYLYNFPEISCVLSGMSTMEQVEQNIEIANSAKANTLTESEKEAYIKAKNTFDELKTVPCTNCKYCLPCPHGVEIPNNFTISNDYKIFGMKEVRTKEYNNLGEKGKASSCVGCRVCESQCPQNIVISEELKIVKEIF